MLVMAAAFVIGMSAYVFAEDETSKPADTGRKTDTYGYERSNEVNKGKQGEAMKALNAEKKEKKKEAIKERKEARKETRESKKEAKETRKEVREGKSGK